MSLAAVHIRVAGRLAGLNAGLDASCHVVVGRTDALEDERAYEAAMGTVSAHRRAKVQAHTFAKDRRLSLLAGLLLDELLGEYGLRERDMTYELGEHGKPAFANRPDVHFSLAHSERMAIAAVSTAPIGVDVEYLPAFPCDLAEPFQWVEPYRWTEMESVGKLLGCGVMAFVDGEPYRRPSDVTIEHVSLDDYLVCIARHE